MSFAENLKQIRKERHLSQEELAEILDVSRQAVSKWEQGTGYPEVEKLLVISSKLNVSLDSLMETGVTGESKKDNTNVTGSIVITSPNENTIVTCNKVCSTGKMKGGKTAEENNFYDHYIGKKCTVEMSDWNDGVSDSYLVGQNDTFIFYVTVEKKQKKVGALAKQYITGITLSSKKDKNPADLSSFTEINMDYFLQKPVTVYLCSKHILDGIFGEDTELMDVGIADIDDEYVKLVSGKEVETGKVTRMEMTLS